MRHLIRSIIGVMFAVTSLISIKHFVEQAQIFEKIREGQEVLKQVNDDVEDIKKFAEESGMISEAKKDFSYFASIMSDLIEHTEIGRRAHFSGLDAIRGLRDYADKIIKRKDKAKVNDKRASLEKVRLVHIADGDTVTVVAGDGLEYRVRLIGIDTPESVNTDEAKNNEYGLMASEHTKNILDGTKELYLEYDKEDIDKYGRLLAYVWLSKDQSSINNMLNARILSDGYAIDMGYEPNDKYAKEFKAIRNEADKNCRGLWAYDEYRALVGEEK